MEHKLFEVQLGFADFAHIAENMRGHAVQRVAPARGANQFQFRQLLAVGFQEGDIGNRQIVLENDLLIFRAGLSFELKKPLLEPLMRNL